MPSPFPGMDPYLEEPGFWPDAHNTLIVVARELLAGQLRPKYYARIEERVYVSGEDDPGRSFYVPDIRVAERRVPTRESGTAAVAVPGVEPEILVTLLDEEIHEPYLAIHDKQDHSVIAVIEILSPTNKLPGAEGRGNYLAKRAEILSSPSHWIEIDLLRTGSPTVPRLAGPYDYIVHVSPADKRPSGLIWRIFLPQRLPMIRIPLKKGDDPVSLDLQQALDLVYDRSDYEGMIDYREPPRVPLTADQAAWADQILKAKGLR